jgi:hypothetical protein
MPGKRAVTRRAETRWAEIRCAQKLRQKKVAPEKLRGAFDRRATQRETLVGSGRGRFFLRCRSSGSYDLFGSQDADEATLPALVFKTHHAIDARVEAVVLRASDVASRLVARAALADQDAAAGDQLPAKAFDPEPLSVRVASIC